MELVNCPEHGRKALVMSCQHVADGYGAEIFVVPEDGEDEATVWCDTCEEARIKDKGWYDYADSIANWKIICSSCLQEAIEDADVCQKIEGIRTPGE